jgi:chromosome segregation ATPase
MSEKDPKDRIIENLQEDIKSLKDLHRGEMMLRTQEQVEISSLQSEVERLKKENERLSELSIQQLDAYSKELFTQINAKNEEINRLKEGEREGVKELLEKQREICADVYARTETGEDSYKSNSTVYNAIVLAPEPEFLPVEEKKEDTLNKE